MERNSKIGRQQRGALVVVQYNHNKGNKTMLKRIANIAVFIIVAEAILFAIFGIIPELLKAGL